MNELRDYISWKVELQTLKLMLMNADNFKSAKKYLKKFHFYDTLNISIFEKFYNLESNDFSIAIGVLSRQERDRFNQPLDTVSFSISNSIDVLDDLHLKRELVSKSYYISEKLKQGANPKEVIKSVRRDLSDLIEEKKVDNSDTASKFMEFIRKIREGKIKFFITGFRQLDNLLYGFGSNDLIVIGARPGQGKTTLALNFMTYQSYKLDLHIKFYSVEMDKESVLINLIAMDKGINAGVYYQNQITEQHEADIIDYLTKYSSHKLEIDDEMISVDDICEDMIFSKAQIFYIDYVQILKNDEKNIFDRISYSMRRLKQTQKKINKPIVLISQAKRPLNKKDVPSKEDLKGSGSIEEEATKIIMINRWLNPIAQIEETQLIIDKNKQGAMGILDINFDGERSRFYE
jgi:replicative DNA helicase